MRRSQPASSNRAVALWLFVCCALIFAMALLGAITRLTQSGLSITDWEPVEGALPPLNHAAWVKAFAAYQQIPQFKILNSSMTLDAFKGIYFWEWLHRLWGRVIGLVFAFPLVYFLLTRRISLRLGAKLFAIFLLGGLQGFIGWFMVESGLSVRTSVSAYRLALHFFDAALLYALILWLALDLIDPRRGRRLVIPIRVAWHGWAALALLSVTMIWGAFTAGLHAGEAYNSWPLMDGEFFPAAALTLLPKWINVFENLAFVQFIHRWLGPVTALTILGWTMRLWRSEHTVQDHRWVAALAGMALLQVALGLTTLLTHAEILVATLHQAGAMALLTLLLINLQRLGMPVTAPATGPASRK